MIKRWWREIGLVILLVITLSYAIDNNNKQCEVKEQVLESNSISFDEAFRKAHKENGAGTTFTWNGNEYKVVFREDD
jgi:hypothetical protein